MKFLCVIFILNQLYYLLNRERLQLSVFKRIYTQKALVYTDIFYFFNNLLYYIWLIFLIFINLNFAKIFLLLGLIRWFLLKPENEKLDYSYGVLKIISLLVYFIN
jgi:hypothetical protein